MIVVSDTSPLNYLILIDLQHILPELFERILIPGAVRDELQSAGAPEAIARFMVAAPAWLGDLPLLRNRCQAPTPGSTRARGHYARSVVARRIGSDRREKGPSCCPRARPSGVWDAGRARPRRTSASGELVGRVAASGSNDVSRIAKTDRPDQGERIQVAVSHDHRSRLRSGVVLHQKRWLQCRVVQSEARRHVAGHPLIGECRCANRIANATSCTARPGAGVLLSLRPAVSGRRSEESRSRSAIGNLSGDRSEFSANSPNALLL